MDGQQHSTEGDLLLGGLWCGEGASKLASSTHPILCVFFAVHAVPAFATAASIAVYCRVRRRYLNISC
eukprot:2788563-Pleurochrysis_carterae.AAC.1